MIHDTIVGFETRAYALLIIWAQGIDHFFLVFPV